MCWLTCIVTLSDAHQHEIFGRTFDVPPTRANGCLKVKLLISSENVLDKSGWIQAVACRSSPTNMLRLVLLSVWLSYLIGLFFGIVHRGICIYAFLVYEVLLHFEL